jgi:hypothetical protein
MKEVYQKQQQQVSKCNATVERNKTQIAKLTATNETKISALSASEEKTRKLLADTTACLVAQADSILAGDSKLPKDIERAAILLLEAAKGRSPLGLFGCAECL